jgi:dihydrofolate reductase
VGAVQLYIAASLDGFIADEDGGVGWVERFLVDGVDYGYGEFLGGVGAVIMGARTYEQELERGGLPYGERPTWVFTHRELAIPPRGTAHLTSAPLGEVLAEIERTTEGNVFLVGGGDLIRQFVAAGALDELILFVVPVLLGRGVRLFDDVAPIQAELLGTRSFATGLVEIRYRVSGPEVFLGANQLT